MSQIQTFNFSAPGQNLWNPQQPGTYYETINHNGQSFSFQAADVPKRKLKPLFGPSKEIQHVRSANVANSIISNPQSFQSEMRLSTFGTTSNSPYRQVPDVINTASPKAKQQSTFFISNQYSGQNGRYLDYSPNTRQNTLVEAESANNSAQKQSQVAGGGLPQHFTYHERSMNNQQSQLNKLNESPFQSMVFSKSNIGNSFSALGRASPLAKTSTSSTRQDFHSPQQSSSKQSHQLHTSLTNSKKEAQTSCLSDSVQQKVSQIVNNHYYPQISQRKSRQLETQSEKSNSSKTKGSYADESYKKWQPLYASARNDQTNHNYSQPYENRQSTEPSFRSHNRADPNLYSSNSNQTKFTPQKANLLSPSSDFAYSDTQRIINKWNAKQRHQSELIYNNHNQQHLNQEELTGSVRKNKYVQSNLNSSNTGQQFQLERFGSEKSIKSNELLSQSPQYQYQSPQTAWGHEEPTGMDDNYTQISRQQLQGQQSTNHQEYPSLHHDSRSHHHKQKDIDSFSDQNMFQHEEYQFNHRDNGRISNNTSSISKQQGHSSQEQQDEHSQNNLQKDQCVEDNYANSNQDENDQIQKQDINELCEDQGNHFEDNYQQYQQILESEKLLSEKQNINSQQYQNDVFQSLSHCADTNPDTITPTLKEISIKSILNLPNTLKQLKAEREPKKQKKNQTTLVVQVAGIILLLSFLYVLLIR